MREGLCTPLAIKAACENHQELVCLPYCLCPVYLVRCPIELCYLPYPTLQDVSCVRGVVGSVEWCIHPTH